MCGSNGFGQLQAHGEPEGAALAWRAFNTDLAAHQQGQSFADGQSESGTTVFSCQRAVRLFESLEQAQLVGRADADAGVLDLEAQLRRACIRGELANAQSADKAKTVDLSSVQLKSNVVQVDVKVVEFNKTQMKKVGLNLFSTAPNSSGFSFGIFGRGSYGTGGGSSTTGAAANPLTQAFNLLMQFDKAGIGVNIGMLEGNNLARVLAAPTLVALSGQSANFLSGGEVPVPVPAGTGMVAIQYKPYGIGLTVSPTVLSNDRIVLKVAPEASELDYANTIVLNSATVPSITTRRADTTVELGDGESFVIGGLVSRNTTSGTDKVPLLGDIPILGVLFKRQEFQQKESELAIVVTPRLVKPLARDVNVEPLLPGRTEQRDPAVWGPWMAGGLSSSVAPGFSR